MVISNIIFLYQIFVIVCYNIVMVTHVFECSIMMTSVDHQACSPEIDPVTSESGQSVNLFCQQSCRVVILVTNLFFSLSQYISDTLYCSLKEHFSNSLIA
jgi:hypothetical protein